MENSKLNVQGGYGLVYQSVMRNKSLSIEAKAIYAYLSSFAGNKSECYPSIDLILNDLKISETRFYKYLNQLIKLNIISKNQKKNKNRWSNVIYKINCFLELQSLQNEGTQNEGTQNEGTQNEGTQNEGTQNEGTQNEGTNNNNINNKNLYSSNEEYSQKGKPFCTNATNAETVKNEFEDAEPAQSNTLTDKEQIKVQRQRYNTEQLKVIDQFFNILKYTRKSCKMADSVILKIYQSWNKHEVQKVIYGIGVYINNPSLHDKNEKYVLGIIRNSTTEEINRKEFKNNESYVGKNYENGQKYREYGNTETFNKYREQGETSDPYASVGTIEL